MVDIDHVFIRNVYNLNISLKNETKINIYTEPAANNIFKIINSEEIKLESCIFQNLIASSEGLVFFSSRFVYIMNVEFININSTYNQNSLINIDAN